MATFTNIIKNSVSSFVNTYKRIKAYLLCEDGTHLLLEDGGKIYIDKGVEYTNLTKN